MDKKPAARGDGDAHGSATYLVRTTNGKTLGGFRTIVEADELRRYWQERLDSSPLATGCKVEIRKVVEA